MQNQDAWVIFFNVKQQMDFVENCFKFISWALDLMEEIDELRVTFLQDLKYYKVELCAVS